MDFLRFNEIMEGKFNKLNWKDIGSIKFSVLFFALMIAKLWNIVLELSWQWYLIMGIVFMIKPAYKLLIKKEVKS